MKTKKLTVEELLDDTETDYLDPIKDLYSESSNYEPVKPFIFFLDLIGYSKEEFGENSYKVEDIQEVLGYHELGALGEALITYSDRPSDTLDLIEKLLSAENEEEE